MNDTHSTSEVHIPQKQPRAEAPPCLKVPRYITREGEDGVTVQVALPGVRKEDLKLTLHESNLRIEGTRSDDVPSDWKTHRGAQQGVRYELRVRLNARLDGTRSTARYEHGVLSLDVPLREESKPRSIEVN